MYLDEPAAALPRIGKETLIPALVCAGVSVLLMRVGFLNLFFLVPLGVCAVVFGPAAGWLGAVFAVLGNGVWSMGVSHVGLYTLGITVHILGFAWVMAGSPPKPVLPPVRTLFRFIAASVVAALVLAVIFSLGNDQGYSALFRSQLDTAVASYIAASGMDAAQQALIKQTFTADRIIDLFIMASLRGVALFTVFFLYFYSRQLAFTVARLFPRYKRRPSGDLIGFHVPRRTIWILSLCLPVILLCRIVPLGVIEIAAWNILVICAIMFLAQGGGIVLFYLARRPIPVIVRLFCAVLLACVIFIPGINVLVFTVLLLLGIAENWLPLRVVKQETPGMDG
jgi:hypothetical protein